MEYQYTRLNATHVEAILALQDRCWIHDEGIFLLSSRALIERAFQFENFAFGAFQGDELIGYITCSVPTRRARMNLGRHFAFTDEELDKVAHANALVIEPEHRRHGIGGRLFQLAMDTLPEKIGYVMTTTRLENVLARQLLERRGFRMESTEEIGGVARAIYVLKQS